MKNEIAQGPGGGGPEQRERLLRLCTVREYPSRTSHCSANNTLAVIPALLIWLETLSNYRGHPAAKKPPQTLTLQLSKSPGAHSEYVIKTQKYFSEGQTGLLCSGLPLKIPNGEKEKGEGGKEQEESQPGLLPRRGTVYAGTDKTANTTITNPIVKAEAHSEPRARGLKPRQGIYCTAF